MTESATPNFSLDLSNEVALVTGTTSGLGRRFAQILAACGAKVVLTGRRVERLNELLAEGWRVVNAWPFSAGGETSMDGDMLVLLEWEGMG